MAVGWVNRHEYIQRLRKNLNAYSVEIWEGLNPDEEFCESLEMERVLNETFLTVWNRYIKRDAKDWSEFETDLLNEALCRINEIGYVDW